MSLIVFNTLDQHSLRKKKKSVLEHAQSQDQERAVHRQERTQSIQYMDAKSTEYENALQNLKVCIFLLFFFFFCLLKKKKKKNVIGETGVTQDLFHGTLVDMKQRVSQIEESISNHRRTISAYKNLPPVRDLFFFFFFSESLTVDRSQDPAKARVEIEKKRSDLQDLEAQLARHISSMNEGLS